MKIVFFGSGAFGLPTLLALADRHELLAVVTQPDRPAGRGRQLTPTPVAVAAAEHLPAVPVLKVDNVNEPSVLERLRALPADAFVVVAFGQRLGPDLLKDRFAINLHASLLPRWRGAAPIPAAILAGDTVTGNSVITLADRIDAGLVLAQSRLPITPDLTAGDLHDRLAADGPALVLDVLDRHSAGALRGLPQDESRVTRAPKLSRRDARLDWSLPADEVRRRVHALNPWPGATVLFRRQPIRILRVADAAGSDAPGTVIDPREGLVACGRGSASRILELQPAGGRPMSWRQFASGARPRAGERFDPIEETAP